MRLILLCLALVTPPALAQQTSLLEPPACIGAFAAESAGASPALKARMNAGYKFAANEHLKAHPNFTAEDFKFLVDTKMIELTTGMKAGKITPDQIDARANACETQYGLPVTDFASLRKPQP